MTTEEKIKKAEQELNKAKKKLATASRAYAATERGACLLRGISKAIKEND